MQSSKIIAVNRAYYDASVARLLAFDETTDLADLHDAFVSMLPARARVLDAGCGTGRDARAFVRRGCEVVAIDASPEMVRYCRRIGLNARRRTFRQLRYSARFDGIWANASLLHLPKSELPDVLGRLRRALRDTGIMFVSLREGRGEGWCRDGRYAALYTQAEFIRVLRREHAVTLLRAWREGSGRRSEGRWLCFLARFAPRSA